MPQRNAAHKTQETTPMKMQLMLAALAAAGFAATPAVAQTSANPVQQSTPAKDLATDRNGDGLISRDEVTPNTNLARRFDERDANKDGVLSSDEYYMPPGTSPNPTGMNHPTGSGAAQQPSPKAAPLQGMAPGGGKQGEGGAQVHAKPTSGSGGASSSTATGGAGGDGAGSGAGGH
jgi:hypothetical protein